MAPEVAKNCFLCAFCGSIEEFREFTYQLPITFRHQPIKIVDGLLKLGHVYIEEAVSYENESGDNFEIYNLRIAENHKTPIENRGKLHRWSSTEEKIKAYDPVAYEILANKTGIRFNCKSCGGEIIGYSTQTFFKCPNCNTRIGDADVIESGFYRERQIIGDDGYLPDWQLPLNINRQRAKSLIKKIVTQNTDHFSGIATNELVADKNLFAVYIPHELSDLRIRTEVKTEKGNHWFYSEWFNWALPKNHFYDAILLEELHPWDFGKMQTYNPAYFDIDVRIVGLCNGWDRIKQMEHILLGILPKEISETYGLKKVNIINWSRDNRKHQFASISLPIYHAEIVGKNGEVNARIMINGQTGRTVAAIRKNNNISYCYLDSSQPEMTYESSMHSVPLAVKYAKSPLLYEITKTFDKEKKKSIFSQLFG